MSSRFPGRGYVVRRLTVRRVAETQMSLGETGPEATSPQAVEKALEAFLKYTRCVR